jgi:hypothetical protein
MFIKLFIYKHLHDRNGRGLSSGEQEVCWMEDFSLWIQKLWTPSWGTSWAGYDFCSTGGGAAGENWPALISCSGVRQPRFLRNMKLDASARQPDRFMKRIVGIALAILAALFTAMMWSGLSVKDLLNALRF